MDIGPGDVVICVQSIWDTNAAIGVNQGQRYTVREVFEVPSWAADYPCPCHDKLQKNALSLVEVGADGRGFCPDLFTKRPPERTELFRSLLENPKILEDA